MDNLRLRGPADRKRINIHEPWELQYWANHFRVSHQQLVFAVRAVGVMTDDVARFLGR